jgi:hypothetical protein
MPGGGRLSSSGLTCWTGGDFSSLPTQLKMGRVSSGAMLGAWKPPRVGAVLDLFGLPEEGRQLMCAEEVYPQFP